MKNYNFFFKLSHEAREGHPSHTENLGEKEESKLKTGEFERSDDITRMSDRIHLLLSFSVYFLFSIRKYLNIFKIM